jgi:hypothetical protein
MFILVERKTLSEIKKTVIGFLYTEKIKSDLILATSLLEALNSMENKDSVGATKLMVAHLKALMGEVNFAVNASGIESFREVNVKLGNAVQQIEQHNYVDAAKLVSGAISITTTSGHQAAQTLRDKDLI